ncbi:HEPN domain-containing protein [Legionella sp. PC997]|uniref:HEPN domain-containing protein n=1 Tax=Legionella sp. PC997 TaxID=2755562 RepID=UPI0015FBE937|nr:HEPN domain-containing protein [Legionella sp. PC997]QMT62075.1 hypothetical protein HBNCFIEN_03483 [Legionella sp. PC997]
MKFTDIKDNDVSQLAIHFIRLSDEYLAVSKYLFTFPSFFNTAATLGHLGIELLLKSLWIWNKKKIPFTHELDYLAQNLSINFSPDQLKQFKKITSFFYHRYLDDESHDSIQKILIEIKDEVFPGMACLPGELGTDDWDKIYRIYEDLLDHLPNELYNEYARNGTKIGALYLKN